MDSTIKETNRRRKIQMEYNEKHGIVPTTISKEIRDVLEISTVAEDEGIYDIDTENEKLSVEDMIKHVEKLTKEMKQAAKDLQFEKAAQLRDEISRIKEEYNL